MNISKQPHVVVSPVGHSALHSCVEGIKMHEMVQKAKGDGGRCCLAGVDPAGFQGRLPQVLTPPRILCGAVLPAAAAFACCEGGWPGGFSKPGLRLAGGPGSDAQGGLTRAVRIGLWRYRPP
jgi:hypothetical protein